MLSLKVRCTLVQQRSNRTRVFLTFYQIRFDALH